MAVLANGLYVQCMLMSGGSVARGSPLMVNDDTDNDAQLTTHRISNVIAWLCNRRARSRSIANTHMTISYTIAYELSSKTCPALCHLRDQTHKHNVYIVRSHRAHFRSNLCKSMMFFFLFCAQKTRITSTHSAHGNGSTARLPAKTWTVNRSYVKSKSDVAAT